MRIKRKCKICGREFWAIKSTQYFCCRKCFKKDYYQRTKQKQIALAKKHPEYHCPVCGHASEIPFDPVKHFDAFNAFVCPWCGIPRSVILQQQYNMHFTVGNPMTAQHVIHSAIISSVSPATLSQISLNPVQNVP